MKQAVFAAMATVPGVGAGTSSRGRHVQMPASHRCACRRGRQWCGKALAVENWSALQSYRPPEDTQRTVGEESVMQENSSKAQRLM